MNCSHNQATSTHPLIFFVQQKPGFKIKWHHIASSYQSITLVSKTRPYRGGGVTIQCREAVKFVAKEQCNLDESLLIKVEANKKFYFIFVVYNPRKNNKMDFLARLEETLENISKKVCSVIICCDLNINILKENNLTEAYFDIINSYGFELLKSEPTQISTSMVSCIHQFITKQVEGKTKTHKDERFSDHYQFSLEIVAKYS